MLMSPLFQISSIKKIVPRLNAMMFKMGFAESINDIKPVSKLLFKWFVLRWIRGENLSAVLTNLPLNEETNVMQF